MAGAPPPEPVVLDGLELCPDPTDPSVWTYVPPGPFLELGPDGRPALGVVDAGPVSFLQITTRLDLPDAAKDSLAGRLPHPQRPPATVRAATVAVTRVAFETRPPDGVWARVAEGVSSGVPRPVDRPHWRCGARPRGRRGTPAKAGRPEHGPGGRW